MRSTLMESGMTMTALYPITAASAAMPMPVLPLVGSIIMPPGARRPSASAARIMDSAALSFALPVGFVRSSLAASLTPGAKRARLMSGVEPMSSVISLKMRDIIKFLHK